MLSRRWLRISAIAAGFLLLSPTAFAQEFDGAELQVSSEMETYVERMRGVLDNLGTVVVERRGIVRPDGSISLSVQGEPEESHLFMVVVDGCDLTCRPGIALSRQTLWSSGELSDMDELPHRAFDTGDSFAAMRATPRTGILPNQWTYTAEIRGATVEYTVHLILMVAD